MTVSFSYFGLIHRPLAKQLADELTGSGVLGCINQLVVYDSAGNKHWLDLENKRTDEGEQGNVVYAVADAYDERAEDITYTKAYIVGSEQEVYASFNINESKSAEDIARFIVGVGVIYDTAEC